jgi:hypothetical protein
MSAFEADRFNHSRTSPEAAVVRRDQGKETNWLTTILKERLQHFCTASRQYAAANLDLVVQERMIHDLHDWMHSARFGIIGTIHQPPDSGMHHRPGAHSARLNCSKQLAFTQTVVTYRGTGLAQGDDLGVGGGIGIDEVAVPASSYDLSAAHDDGAHGNFSNLLRPLGAA